MQSFQIKSFDCLSFWLVLTLYAKLTITFHHFRSRKKSLFFTSYGFSAFPFGLGAHGSYCSLSESLVSYSALDSIWINPEQFFKSFCWLTTSKYYVNSLCLSLRKRSFPVNWLKMLLIWLAAGKGRTVCIKWNILLEVALRWPWALRSGRRGYFWCPSNELIIYSKLLHFSWRSLWA